MYNGNFDKGVEYIFTIADGTLITAPIRWHLVPSEFTCDGNYIVICCTDSINLLECKTKTKIAELNHEKPLKYCHLSPQGSLLVSVDFNDSIKVWSLSTYTEQSSFPGESRHIESIEFSDDEKYFLITYNDMEDFFREKNILCGINENKVLYSFKGEELYNKEFYKQGGTKAKKIFQNNGTSVLSFATQPQRTVLLDPRLTLKDIIIAIQNKKTQKE